MDLAAEHIEVEIKNGAADGGGGVGEGEAMVPGGGTVAVDVGGEEDGANEEDGVGDGGEGLKRGRGGRRK